MSPTDLTTYLADRDTLIKQDRALRVDANKLENLSATEAAAEEIVRALRAEEAVSVWAAEHEDIEHPFPGMEFLTSRSVIMKTKVFDLLHKVRAVYFIFCFRCVSHGSDVWDLMRCCGVDRCQKGRCFMPIWRRQSMSTFC